MPKIVLVGRFVEDDTTGSCINLPDVEGGPNGLPKKLTYNPIIIVPYSSKQVQHHAHAPMTAAPPVVVDVTRFLVFQIQD
jgi:hypothetical protein